MITTFNAILNLKNINMLRYNIIIIIIIIAIIIIIIAITIVG
jgi:hypothetical protein